MAYRLALPLSLEGVHNVFHVSQLRRYIRDESYILDYSELELQPDLSYTEQPMAIMDRTVKTLKNQTIPLVLVSWNIVQEKQLGSEKMSFLIVTRIYSSLEW